MTKFLTSLFLFLLLAWAALGVVFPEERQYFYTRDDRLIYIRKPERWD